MGYAKNVVQTKQYLWDFDATNTEADSHTATGTIQFFSASANCMIKSVTAHVVTAVTGSSAEEVGDGTDVDGFIVDGFAATAGVYPLYVQGVATTFAGAFAFDSQAGATDAADVSIEHKNKFYSSADTIDYKITGTATAGKVRFFVEFIRF